jgi:glycosyltransferase involved in cell wall biosynthesis
MSAVPRLSIGLPVYNGESYLAESLDSLLGQTYAEFELIISDNASTDATAEICRHYARQDSRIRYIRQGRNIGCAPNHNFVVAEAKGELFKSASHDDVYAQSLIERCIEALDEDRQTVLVHSWSAGIDGSGTVTHLVDYPAATGSARAADRLRSMLFDGWSDDEGGVVRMEVLRRAASHASYHFADRTFTVGLALQGPFYIISDWLYFRRYHPDQGGKLLSVRGRCANLDPRRADRLRHPAVRLYAEYVWGFVDAIRRAPLSSDDRTECYGVLARWATSRVLPVAKRSIRRGHLSVQDVHPTHQQPLVRLDSVVPGIRREECTTRQGQIVGTTRPTRGPG